MTFYNAEIIYDSESGAGYSLVTHSNLSEVEKKAIWLNSLPEGSNWNLPQYRNKKITKTFSINGKFAVSTIEVTSDSDEIGRKGLLNARINLYSQKKYKEWLHEEFHRINHSLYLNEVSTTIQVIFQRIKNLKFQDSRLAIYRPFNNQKDIEYNFALLISLCVNDNLRTKIANWHQQLTFTSFALSPRDSSSIICLPQTENVKENLSNNRLNIYL